MHGTSSSSSSSPSSSPSSCLHRFLRYFLSFCPQFASPISKRKLIIFFILGILIVVYATLIDLEVHDWIWMLFGGGDDAEEAREIDLMRKSLNMPSEPLRCKKSAALEFSPSLLKEYGSVEDNWCELMTTASAAEEQTKHVYSATSVKLNSNGSTYFRYPHTAGEPGWNYFQCPVQHRIRCNNKNNNKKKIMMRKAKALVIYIVASSLDAYQAHQETNNFNFFLKNGLVPANTPTALFDSVDFVFAKIQLQGEKTDREFLDCGRLGELKNEKQNSAYSNIRFLMIPKVPCDLCAHAKILEYLKVANATDNLEEQDYDQVIMMNNGMRGPFFNRADDDRDDHESNHVPRTTWIDFVSMAGRRKIPNPRSGFFAQKTNRTSSADDEVVVDDCPLHISTSSSISWQGRVHHQSFFVSQPIEIVKKKMYSLFKGVCPADENDNYHGKKKNTINREEEISGSAAAAKRKQGFDKCILQGELDTGVAILSESPKWAMYSLSKQVYVQDLGSDNRKKENQYYHPPRNPTTTWADPCKSVFVKDGGQVWKTRKMNPGVLNALNHLTMGGLNRKRRMMNGIKNRNKNQKEKNIDEVDEDIFSWWNWKELDKMFQSHGCPWTWSSDKEFKIIY